MRLGRRQGTERTRQRRRGRLVTTVAVAAVTVTASVVVAGESPASAKSSRDRHGARERERARDRDRQRERSSRQTQQDPGPETGRPAQFVAERDGRIVVVSAETGRVERILTAELPGDGTHEPALSPDGRRVWFSRRDGSCAAHLASVPLAGGREEKLPGSGEAGPEGTPLPRPGRAQIAYSRVDCKDAHATLIVGDLAGLEGRGQTGLVPLAWSRDGERLLATAADSDEVHLLDVSNSGAIVANQRLDPTDPTPECRLAVVGFSPDDNDGYVALRRCGPSGESARRTLVLLDKDGAYRKTVVRLSRGQDFTDQPAFDTSGHSLLYATAPAEIDAGSGPQPEWEVTLWVWRDGETRALARQNRYTNPVWLP